MSQTKAPRRTLFASLSGCWLDTPKRFTNTRSLTVNTSKRVIRGSIPEEYAQMEGIELVPAYDRDLYKLPFVREEAQHSSRTVATSRI